MAANTDRRHGRRWAFPAASSETAGTLQARGTKAGFLTAFSQGLNCSGVPLEDLVVLVELKRGITVTGVVADSSLVPVPGAGVALRFTRGSLVPSDVVVASRRSAVHSTGHLKTMTSADGRFSLSGLSPDATDIRLLAAHRGRIFKPTRLSFATARELENMGEVTIVLERR